MPSSNEPSPCARAPTKNIATRASSYKVRKRALLTWPYASMSDQRRATSYVNRSVTREFPVRDPVRAGRLGAEPVDLVLLVRLEVALEPEPAARILVGALPRQHVGRHPVQEHPVVADHHRAAGELQQRVLQRRQRLH